MTELTKERDVPEVYGDGEAKWLSMRRGYYGT